MRARSLLGWSLLLVGCGGGAGSGPTTVAEIDVVRPSVRVGGRPIGEAERVAEGAVVAVGEGGRAWLSHDAAARLLLDGGAQVTIAPDGIKLDAGRVWVDASDGARTRITTSSVEVVASAAGFEASRKGEALHLTVARGELTWHSGEKRGQVRAGETADLGPGGAEVHAEPLWDDWTGGLAWPDPGHGGGTRSLGEIGARRPGSLGEARFPLAITRLEVRTKISGDLAQTRVIETFFNPASDTLEGLYRVRVPEGSLLARFAIDRDGRWADGYVKERQAARAQYQAQVYEGSTKDPALLEWEAPGQFRARIYPIPAGATRRVLIEYSEWLTPHGDAGRDRTWRFPMAGGADGPVIQELDVEVDTDEGEAATVRAGLGARIEKKQVILERTDFRPRADLVVDLVGQPRDEGQAKGYRSAHRVRGAKSGEHEDDYYLARPIPLPLEPARDRPPLDLVIVADVSAGTDATHLQLTRTVIESLLEHLDDKDKVAVVGADLGLHPLPVGALAPSEKAGLQTANQANVDKMLDALARAATGGATDLGATLSEAATLVAGGAAGRRGAVIYVGDAFPTVGEVDVKALRERLDRLPVPLRLYGVAIGDDADLALLEGLSSDGGLALRVGDRPQAAEAALRLLGHASKRAAFRVKVDLGAGVDRVYPRRPTAVVEGEALPILARVRTGVPSEVTITGVLDGKPFTVKRRLSSAAVGESNDLRLRWSSARLAQLLADGASAEEVAELGTRQNLITPFTSYYVPSADELGPVDQDGENANDETITDISRSSTRHRGEEGKMGKREASKPKPGSYAMKEGRDDPAPTSQAAPMAEPAAPVVAAVPPAPSPKAAMDFEKRPAADIASSAGILGVMGADKPDETARFWANQKDRNGDDSGLGLKGTGPGGGGTGEGSIGLGNLGTRGGSHASGQGYGRGAGGTTGRSSASPTVALGDPTVLGSLDKEIVRRIIRAHVNEVRYCYEKGVMAHPGIQGRINVRFTIAPTGSVSAANVLNSTVGDNGVEQCVATAVRRWQFPKPAGGGIAVVTYPFVFTGGGSGALEVNPRELYASADDRTVIQIHIGITAHRPRHCSPASKLDAADRAILWKERLTQHGGIDGAMEIWQDAKSSCELKNWGDRRELLRSMLASVGGASQLVALYRRFDDSPAEQDFLRRAVLGKVRTANDLRIIYDGIGLSEDVKGTLVDEVIAKAKSPEDRVTGLQQLIQRWPQDLKLKLKMIEALEAVKRVADARRIADEVRKSPYPDAQARTLVGEFLARQGDEPAARRAFSEIVEFAPRDPLARRRLGDLYRAHGWFEEAYRQYQTLATISPGDPSVLLLEASAAAGAGRTDEALRLEQRVAESTEPGAEAGIARVALWWSTVRQAELRETARKSGDAAEVARLLGRARRTGVLRDARPFRAFLTWAHPEADCELEAALPGAPMSPATDVAPEFGLSAIASRDPVHAPVTLQIKRSSAASALKYQAKLIVLWEEGEKGEQLREFPLEFGPGISGYRVAVNGRDVEVSR